MTMRPASDLCDICRKNHLQLSNLQKLNVQEQAEILKNATDHLEEAKMQREFYNSYREKSKSKSQSTLFVISFDFAQNICYPSSPQQVGASYFKSNRKCNIFGIQNFRRTVILELLNQNFPKFVVDCHQDFLEIIQSSSPNNFNVAVPSIHPSTNIRNVKWAEWDSYLAQYFKQVPGLTKYHHFKFNEDGTIIAKKFANCEEIVVHKKTLLNENNISPLKIIRPPGLSAQRACGIYMKRFVLLVPNKYPKMY